MRISDWSSDVCSSDLIGNFAHHKILADLREQQTSYFIPQAGWFRRVTCPHYCFEVVAWIGMALMSHQWAMLLLAFVLQIGRASCRARVCTYVEISVVSFSLKQNKY